VIGIYSEKRAETSHGKDPGGRQFRGQSRAWRADSGREGAWNRGLGVLVDGNVGFTGAHGVEDIWRVSPPYAPLGSAGLVRRVAEQRRKKLVGCTAHQLLIGAPITSSALESGQRELIATEATPARTVRPTSPAIVRRIDDRAAELACRARACLSE